MSGMSTLNTAAKTFGYLCYLTQEQLQSCEESAVAGLALRGSTELGGPETVEQPADGPAPVPKPFGFSPPVLSGPKRHNSAPTTTRCRWWAPTNCWARTAAKAAVPRRGAPGPGFEAPEPTAQSDFADHFGNHQILTVPEDPDVLYPSSFENEEKEVKQEVPEEPILQDESTCADSESGSTQKFLGFAYPIFPPGPTKRHNSAPTGDCKKEESTRATDAELLDGDRTGTQCTELESTLPYSDGDDDECDCCRHVPEFMGTEFMATA